MVRIVGRGEERVEEQVLVLGRDLPELLGDLDQRLAHLGPHGHLLVLAALLRLDGPRLQKQVLVNIITRISFE